MCIRDRDRGNARWENGRRGKDSSRVPQYQVKAVNPEQKAEQKATEQKINEEKDENGEDFFVNSQDPLRMIRALEQTLTDKQKESEAMKAKQMKMEDQMAQMAKMLEELTLQVNMLREKDQDREKESESLKKEIEFLHKQNELQKRSLSKMLSNQKESHDQSNVLEWKNEFSESQMRSLEDRLTRKIEESNEHIPEAVANLNEKLGQATRRIERLEQHQNEVASIRSTPHYQSDLISLNSMRQPPAVGTTVYMTYTGSCYHRENCKSLNSSKYPLSMQEAISRGLRKCLRCQEEN
eukprot:TRINITY_DN2003_c0_g1_i6.p1 TRINITY_DN2003_c0_g1~~TRINITY_DN2003_c0_g1_i6.p1  ORF type:complete len:295 (-),score=71.09 TRINITY_DN2003_c0_g1_i6:984-1868(-)